MKSFVFLRIRFLLDFTVLATIVVALPSGSSTWVLSVVSLTFFLLSFMKLLSLSCISMSSSIQSLVRRFKMEMLHAFNSYLKTEIFLSDLLFHNCLPNAKAIVYSEIFVSLFQFKLYFYFYNRGNI